MKFNKSTLYTTLTIIGLYIPTHTIVSYASYNLDKEKSYVEHLINLETFPLSGMAYIGILGFATNLYIMSNLNKQEEVKK